MHYFSIILLPKDKLTRSTIENYINSFFEDQGHGIIGGRFDGIVNGKFKRNIPNGQLLGILKSSLDENTTTIEEYIELVKTSEVIPYIVCTSDHQFFEYDSNYYRNLTFEEWRDFVVDILQRNKGQMVVGVDMKYNY